MATELIKTNIETTFTIPQAAERLREFAELTASNSQNWSNFEGVCVDMIRAAFDAGKEAQKKEEFAAIHAGAEDQ